MNSTDTPAQQVAEQVRDGMLTNDRATRSLGIRVKNIAPGQSQLEMQVSDDMLNGFDMCHGGLITTLADSAFAFACNARNAMTVASGLSIDFLAPARAGDVLVAQAHEVSLSGRTGVYDVAVHNQRGELVAVFRGRSYAMKGRTTVVAAAPDERDNPHDFQDLA